MKYCYIVVQREHIRNSELWKIKSLVVDKILVKQN